MIADRRGWKPIAQVDDMNGKIYEPCFEFVTFCHVNRSAKPSAGRIVAAIIINDDVNNIDLDSSVQI